MRRLLIVGAVSLASALGASCGDDDSTGPLTNGGTGGMGGTGGGNGGDGGSSVVAGSGGTSGSSGSSGAAGGSGSSGVAGSNGNAGTSGAAGSGTVVPDAGTGDAGTGDAGDGGAPPPCTGCMELRVPFTATTQAAFFQLQFSARSLADTVVTIRVGAAALDQTGETFVQTFATDNSGFSQINGAFTQINAANFTNTSTFIDLTLDFPNLSNVDFDEADVIALGLQLGSGGNFVGPTTSVLMVDSITFTGTSGLTDLSFTTDAGGFALNVNTGLQTSEAIHHPE